jgi:hypothetical protein
MCKAAVKPAAPEPIISTSWKVFLVIIWLNSEVKQYYDFITVGGESIKEPLINSKITHCGRI